MSDQNQPRPAKGKKVYVVGGGIAGLTAAHELVDRGFEVTVWEDGRLGGLARTQWCFSGDVGSQSPPDPEGSVATMQALEPTDGPVFRFEAAFPTAIFFEPASFELNQEAQRELEQSAKALEDYAAALRRDRRPFTLHMVAVEGAAAETEFVGRRDVILEPIVGRYGITDVVARDFAKSTSPTEGPVRRLSRLRALVVKSWLDQRLASVDRSVLLVVFTDIGLGGALPEALDDSSDFGPGMSAEVTFRVYDPRVPGEHGYRYFPAFYRHVFDTMRRTPLLVAPQLSPRAIVEAREINRVWTGAPLSPENKVESTRTVFDNLVPTRSFKIAAGDGSLPIEVSRTRARSFREISQMVKALFHRFRVDARDLARFQLKIAQYLTSCPDRRQTYEDRTWAEFIGAERCSKPFQKIIERWPQALIGIRAQLADARTIGSIAVQLLLDQLTVDGARDCTLNGPTSVAWLSPWVAYLSRRGVPFESDRLTGLRLEEGRVRPVWRRALGNDPPDYLVLAVPLREARRLTQSLWESLSEAERRDFPATLQQIRDFLGEPLPGTDAMPVGPEGESGSLRHYGGIQFYLSYDLGPADGHIYLADSDWRLSAISQAQFWQARLKQPGPDDTIPGGDFVCILSVDIGDWYAPSRRGGIRAVDCDRDQLAAEVWKQIEEGISTTRWSPPEPLAYHIDDDMIFEAGGKPTENRAPYLVNVAGGWDRRPGPDDLQDGYPIFFDSLAVAGTFMKTYTRLATMESANESARHAVNGLLGHYRDATRAKTSRACQVWDPEEHEIDDLVPLKEIDAALMRRGLPHLLEILDVERLVDGGLDVLTPDAILLGVLGGLGLEGAATPTVAGLPLALLRRALEALFG